MRNGSVAAAFAALIVGCAPDTPPEMSASQSAPQPQPLSAPAQPQKPAARIPAPDSLPPLPAVSFRPPRPIETVQAVYRFAALNPEVLRYVPCFCGCERSHGHRDNEDCFIASRAADGSVSWDAHGLG
jgi:hypothetical protein